MRVQRVCLSGVFLLVLCLFLMGGWFVKKETSVLQQPSSTVLHSARQEKKLSDNNGKEYMIERKKEEKQYQATTNQEIARNNDMEKSDPPATIILAPPPIRTPSADESIITHSKNSSGRSQQSNPAAETTDGTRGHSNIVEDNKNKEDEQREEATIAPLYPPVGGIMSMNGFLSWHRNEPITCGGQVPLPMDSWSVIDENTLVLPRRNITTATRRHSHHQHWYWWSRYYSLSSSSTTELLPLGNSNATTNSSGSNRGSLVDQEQQQRASDPLVKLGRPWTAHNCSHQQSTSPSPSEENEPQNSSTEKKKSSRRFWQCATTFAKDREDHEALLRFNLLDRCFNGVKPSQVSINDYTKLPSSTNEEANQKNRKDSEKLKEEGAAKPTYRLLPRYLFLGHSHCLNYYKAVCLELQRLDPALFDGSASAAPEDDTLSDSSNNSTAKVTRFKLPPQECPRGRVHDECHIVRDGLGRIILAFDWSPYVEVPLKHPKRLRDAKFDYIVLIRGMWDMLSNNTFPDDMFRNTLHAVRSVRAHYQPRRIILVSPNHPFRDDSGRNTFYRDDSVPPLGLDPRGRNMDLQCNTLNRRGMVIEGTYCAAAAAASDDWATEKLLETFISHREQLPLHSRSNRSRNNDVDEKNETQNMLQELELFRKSVLSSGKEEDTLDLISSVVSPSTSIEVMTTSTRMLSTGAGFQTKCTRGNHFNGMTRRALAVLIMNQLCRPPSTPPTTPAVTATLAASSSSSLIVQELLKKNTKTPIPQRKPDDLVGMQQKKKALMAALRESIPQEAPQCKVGVARLNDTTFPDHHNPNSSSHNRCGPEPEDLMAPMDRWSQRLMHITHSIVYVAPLSSSTAAVAVSQQNEESESHYSFSHDSRSRYEKQKVPFLVTRLSGRIIQVVALQRAGGTIPVTTEEERERKEPSLLVFNPRGLQYTRGYKPVREVPGCSLMHTEHIITTPVNTTTTDGNVGATNGTGQQHISFFGVHYSKPLKLHDWTRENVWKPEMTRNFINFSNSHSSNCGQPLGAIFWIEKRNRTKQDLDSMLNDTNASSSLWSWRKPSGPEEEQRLLLRRHLPFPAAVYKKVRVVYPTAPSSEPVPLSTPKNTTTSTRTTTTVKSTILRPRNDFIFTPYHTTAAPAWNSVNLGQCLHAQGGRKVMFHGHGFAVNAFDILSKALCEQEGSNTDDDFVNGAEIEREKSQARKQRTITYEKKEFEVVLKDTQETVLFYTNSIQPHNGKDKSEFYPFHRRNLPVDIYSYTHIVVDWSSWFSGVNLSDATVRQDKILDMAHALHLFQSVMTSSIILVLMPSEGTVWNTLIPLLKNSPRRRRRHTSHNSTNCTRSNDDDDASEESKQHLRKEKNIYLNLLWLREMMYCACLLAQRHGVAVQPVETADLFNSNIFFPMNAPTAKKKLEEEESQQQQVPVEFAMENLVLRLALTICASATIPIETAPFQPLHHTVKTTWPLALSLLQHQQDFQLDTSPRGKEEKGAYTSFSSLPFSSWYYYTLLPMPKPPRVLEQNKPFRREAPFGSAALFASPGLPLRWKFMVDSWNYSFPSTTCQHAALAPINQTNNAAEEWKSEPFIVSYQGGQTHYRTPLAYMTDDDFEG